MNLWRRLALLLLLASTAALADDFRFLRVQLGEIDGQLTISADIDYPLNDTTLEALENGVPLTFVTHIEIRASDAWIWQPDLIDLRLRSTLGYHPLSALYELHQLDTDRVQQFATREAALRALGELRDLAIVSRSELEPGKEYRVRMDTYLDLEALPLPLRPLAHLTPSWHLESDTWKSTLTP